MHSEIIKVSIQKFALAVGLRWRAVDKRVATLDYCKVFQNWMVILESRSHTTEASVLYSHSIFSGAKSAAEVSDLVAIKRAALVIRHTTVKIALNI
jgi:hypothetical protein